MVDVNNTRAPGFQWYTSIWMYSGFTPITDLFMTSKRGVPMLEMTGASSLYSARKVDCAAGDDGNNCSVGNLFSHGAYFEARLAFAKPAANTMTGWPSFWSLADLGRNTFPWPGSNNMTIDFNNSTEYYDFDTEADIMEFFPPAKPTDTPEISSTLHDWYGYQYVTCATPSGKPNVLPSPGFCQATVDPKAKDTPYLTFESASDNTPTFNTFGFLWVPWNPATPNVPGYAQFYINNLPIGEKTSWFGTPPPVTAKDPNPMGILPGTPANPITYWPSSKLPDWTFGAMDLWSRGLILETGGDAFMDVQWVRAWQLPP